MIDVPRIQEALLFGERTIDVVCWSTGVAARFLRRSRYFARMSQRSRSDRAYKRCMQERCTMAVHLAAGIC